MSDANQAVFLSYASQDAEAAKRVCEALRAAGVEVWFDQNELVGGDAWDQKIRGQIGSCALFVPVISAGTQSRGEGYFRLEWKLAVDRSHLMAHDQPFLLPVVIDATPDSAARVPPEFKTVQWTRLPGGETPPAFVARVKKLLDAGAEVARVSRPVDPENTGQETRATRRPKRASWLIPLIAGSMAVIGLALWQPWRAPAKPATVAAAVVGLDEVTRIRSSLRPDQWTRADFDSLAPTIDRLIQANPENGDAWALRSIAHSLLVVRNLDSGTKPLEVGREAAERAARLAPTSALAELSQGLHLIAMISRGGDPLACRTHVDKALAGLPPNETLTRYTELCSYWIGYQFEGTERSAQSWLTADPRATFPAWILAQYAVARRQSPAAEKWGQLASVDLEITGVRTFVTLFESRYYLRADLTASRAALDRIPTGQRGVPRVVASRWLLAMAEQNYDLALQELSRTPESMLRDRVFHGPKALLAALTHESAGRPEAAAPQFREAERILHEELEHDADNLELRTALALTLAHLGRAEDARRELEGVEPLLRGREPSVYSGQLYCLVAQTHGALGEFGPMVTWLRRLLSEPSGEPFCPASLRLDPRFTRYLADARVTALLTEFAGLDPATSTPAAAIADQKSVAVLAFANLSEDKGNEYFSDGISEELLNVLAKIPGLKVSARTSAFSFKGKEVPVPEIARQLGVAYIIEGSVRKSGDRVRITAQLIKAADGFHVWSDTFTRDLKDIFAVQDEIAGLIAQQLQLKLGETGAKAAVDPAIYELLLQARSLTLRDNNADNKRAVALYRLAVEREPRLAMAWAEMARSLIQLGRFGGLPTADAMREARDAGQKALELDPDQPIGLVALGWVQRTADWDWRGARRSFQRALELAPGNPAVMGDAAVFFFNIGQVAEGQALARAAVELDPLNARAQATLGFILTVGGEWAQGLVPMQKAVELAPAIEEVRCHMARDLAGLGRTTEAEAVALQEPNEAYRWVALTIVYAKRGDDAASRKVLNDFIAKYGEEMPGYVMNLYGGRGEVDLAFQWLDRSLARRDAALPWSKTNFNCRTMHDDPRWMAFLRKVGLTDEQLK